MEPYQGSTGITLSAEKWGWREGNGKIMPQQIWAYAHWTKRGSHDKTSVILQKGLGYCQKDILD